MNAERVSVRGSFSANLTGKVHSARMVLHVLAQVSITSASFAANIANKLEILVFESNVLVEAVRPVELFATEMTNARRVMRSRVRFNSVLRRKPFAANVTNTSIRHAAHSFMVHSAGL